VISLHARERERARARERARESERERERGREGERERGREGESEREMLSVALEDLKCSKSDILQLNPIPNF